MNISLKLLLLLSPVLFFISCSDENTTGKNEIKYCSAQYPEGICKDQNKVCKNGLCITVNKECNPACDNDHYCDNGTCKPKGNNNCNDGDFQCLGNTQYQICNNGNWSSILSCNANEICNSNLKQCTPQNEMICSPGEKKCSLDRKQILTCDSEGKKWLEDNCSENTFCTDNGNQITCKETTQNCTPNESICATNSSYKTCNSDGNGYLPPVNCPEQTTCFEGQCRTQCEIAEERRSYIGCEYYAIDLDNMAGIFRNDESQTPYYYSIIVSNPSSTAATVTVSDNQDISITKQVAPDSIEIFNLETLNYLGTTENGSRTFHEWEDTHQIISTAKGLNYSYKITSNLPIIAYQFSPLGGSSNYSNDASMLIPTSVYDKEYKMLSWEHWKTSSQTMTIIAKEDNTNLTINFTAQTKAGENIPQQNPGNTYQVTLSKGETIQFASQSGDLSGSYIQADKPIGVFGGHSCTNIPNDKSACDHIEEQLLPINTWGTHYVIVKTKKRGQETEYYKIIAEESNTTLVFDPPVHIDGISSPVSRTTIRDAGKVTVFSTKDSFELTASKSIMIGQFITSQNDVTINPLEHPTGDPAFIIQVPVEQYRTSYLFLVPDTYAQNYVTIVTTPNEDGTIPVVYLDNNPINASDYLAVGNYFYTIKEISSGAHSVNSSNKTGISVYGYDQYVSYGYPGGLDLKNLKGF